MLLTAWYVNDVLQNDVQFTATFSYTFDTAGTYVIKAYSYYYDDPIYNTSTVTVTADDSGTTDPDPDPEPSESPDPDPEPSESPDPDPEPSDDGGETTGDWVTNTQMNTSQSSQTSTIIASIESESTIIQNAVKSLETTLSNSAILDYLKQSLTFRDFDFATGELSTTTNTYEGIVPLFAHWAQNVEEYLGILVEARGNEVEESVKEQTTGFWDILLGLFKPKDNGDKANANTDDLNTVLGIGQDVQSYFDAGGNITDFASVFNSEDTWAWFGDAVASEIDNVPSTYSREIIIDYRAEVYNEFYQNVLGRNWGG